MTHARKRLRLTAPESHADREELQEKAHIKAVSEKHADPLWCPFTLALSFLARFGVCEPLSRHPS